MSEPAQMHTHHVQHRELLVQVQINRGIASDGGSGTSADAMVSVLVTLDGEPVDDLGANAGHQASAISLPPGWTLQDGFNVRPGGSGVSVTEFGNMGGGIYDIRIVPYLDNPPVPGCRGSTYTPFSSSSRAPSAVRPLCSGAGHWES